MDKIYHYTNIESLALILSSKTLRFSRLDTVDDVTEAERYEGVPFGKYIFISCWTKNGNEDLAQWEMYGARMRGVRIELPAYPFRKVLLESIPPIQIHGEQFGPLSTKEILGDGYMIIPAFDDIFFAGEITYEPENSTRHAASLKIVDTPNGPIQQLENYYDLIRLKSDAWKFQREFRFSLHVAPLVPPFPPGIPRILTNQQIAGAHQAMVSGVDPGTTHIDVPIDLDAVDKMVIRTGPCCTPADRVCIEALQRVHAPQAKIEQSGFNNKVRRRAG